MKDLHRLFIFLLIPIFLQHFCEAEDDLKKSVNSLIQVFRRHDRHFIFNLKPLIPSILAVSRAQLHVRWGTLNVTYDVEEDIETMEKELARYSSSFLQSIDKTKLSGSTIGLRVCIKTLNEVLAKRNEFLDAEEENVNETASEFRKAFVDKLIIASDVLYESLYNKFHPNKQLFEQFAVASHQHPIQTMEFMHGCFQILTQLMMLEVNHVEMSLATNEAIQVFEAHAKQRLHKILDVAYKIDERHQSYTQVVWQIEKDQKRFHEKWRSLSHCSFAHRAKAYFDGKYPKFKYFVISYDTVRGFDSHAFASCVTKKELLSYHSRNSVIFMLPSYYNGNNFFDWAKRLLDRVPDTTRIRKDRALEVLIAIQRKMDKQCQLAVTFVITMRATVCFEGPAGYSVETFKNAEKCNTRLCWFKRIYPQRVILAGRRS